VSQKAFYIDSSLCTGCKSCQVACKSVHGLPAEDTGSPVNYSYPAKITATTWTYVAENSLHASVKRMCNHCSSAECLKNCPEAAITKYAGMVLIDQDRCIGCGTCEKVCPYQAVGVLHRDVKKMKRNKAFKCDACVSFNSNSPACVKACPTESLTFGNRLNLIKRAKSRLEFLLKSGNDYAITGIQEHGGLNVITVAHKNNTMSYNSTDSASFDAVVAKALYRVLTRFSFGISSVKRKAWKTALSLTIKNTRDS
jgi:formate dehydrogenase iron-sulfur subunit